jgi:hypothetical protein
MLEIMMLMSSANVMGYDKLLILREDHLEMILGELHVLLLTNFFWAREVELSFIRLFYFNFRLLRLEFDHSHLEYYTELDAVLLVGTRKPIPSPEAQQVPSYNLMPPIRKLTAQILQLNIHNIPSQVGFRQVLKIFHES